jgi:GST-like protein
MIRLYYGPGPNPSKVALFLEETGLAHELIPIDTRKGEQHGAAFRAVNPNGKLPAIIDTEGPDGKEARVFDSNAILLYLAEKTDKLLGTKAERPEMLSWLMFIASGLGPYSGQSVHFSRAAPEKLPYAINRYLREAERHFTVLDAHLAGKTSLLDSGYSIVDIAAWGWIDRANFVLGRDSEPLAGFANLQRWFSAVDARPAVARARAIAAGIVYKTEMDEQAKRALFPSNYPRAA